MTQDLRRTVAKSNLYRRDYPRDKWAPGAWQAAVAYRGKLPEVRCPVVLGGDSMFRTPEELRDFRQLPHVPAVTKTIRSTLLGFPNGKAPEPIHDKDVVQVTDLSQRELIELEKCTQGTTIIVWFGGKPRYAWLPRSANPESKPARTAETPPAVKVPPTETLVTESASGNPVMVDGQQKQSTFPQEPAQESKEAAPSPSPADLEPEATTQPLIAEEAQQDPVEGAEPPVGTDVDEGGGGTTQATGERVKGDADGDAGKEEGDAAAVGEELTTEAAAADVADVTDARDVTGVGDATGGGEEATGVGDAAGSGEATEVVDTAVAAEGVPSRAAKSAQVDGDWVMVSADASVA